MASVLDETFRHEVLPEGWEVKKIKDISKWIQYGYTWKITETWPFRYLRITDIQNGAVNWNTVPYINISVNEAKKYFLNKGDIVFARTGATVWKSFLINEEIQDKIFASYLIRLILIQEKIAPKYLLYFFQSHEYWEQIYADTVWAAQPNFNGNKLWEICVPLPPLPEQARIVARLDDLFHEIRALRAEYETRLSELRALRASILASAFRGEL